MHCEVNAARCSQSIDLFHLVFYPAPLNFYTQHEKVVLVLLLSFLG